MGGSGAPQLNRWGAAWGRVPCGSGDHLLLECFVVISGHRPWAGCYRCSLVVTGARARTPGGRAWSLSPGDQRR